MTIDPILLTRLQKLWNALELRLLVLLSLFLQVVLIFTGNRRKYTKRKWVAAILWISYLSADSVATLALGVLSQAEGDSNNGVDSKYTITVFWAPFLLMHLGGPDTITAYALADNELWSRHLLGLAGQVTVAFYIFLRSFSFAHLNFLWLVIFLTGVVKYGERSWVLFAASKDRYRDSLVSQPDPGVNYAKFMEEAASKEEEGYRVSLRRDVNANPPSQGAVEANGGDVGISDTEVLQKAGYFFRSFRKLFADLILSLQDRENSVSYFEKLRWRRAFLIVEIELGFVYDLLYTKSPLVFSRAGILLRLFTCSSTIATFVAFQFLKNGYPKTEVIITYVLLGGAVFLEIYAIVILFLSDRMMIWLNWDWTTRPDTKVPGFVSLLYRLHLVPARWRWSNSMGQYNIFEHCLKYMPKPGNVHWYPECIHGLIVKLRQDLDKYLLWKSEPVEADLKDLIFGELKKRAEKGERRKVDSYWIDQNLIKTSCFDEVEFDQSVLLWHIATDMCYHTTNIRIISVDDERQRERCSHIATYIYHHTTNIPDISVDDERQRERCSHIATDICRHCRLLRIRRERCRLLSNYMVHLLITSPFMLPSGIGQVRFQDTCVEATEFFDNQTGLEPKSACMKLSEVKARFRPSEVKGDVTKSLLFDACRLAEYLKKLETDETWETITQAWLDMLMFAAAQCSWSNHAEKLSQGGELLTHVWLLMAHFGMTDQFQISQGFKAKLETK